MHCFSADFPYSAGTAQFAPLAASHVDPVVLAAGVSYTHPVPAGAGFVVFGFEGDVYVRFGAAEVTASRPEASATSGQGSELNPTQRRIPAGATHIALHAQSACRGSLAFYK